MRPRCNQFSPELLEQLRNHETAPGSGLPRTKRHDDATIAGLTR